MNNILYNIVFRFAIGSDLCEENFMIIAGDGHCFDIRGHTVCSLITMYNKYLCIKFYHKNYKRFL